MKSLSEFLIFVFAIIVITGIIGYFYKITILYFFDERIYLLIPVVISLGYLILFVVKKMKNEK